MLDNWTYDAKCANDPVVQEELRNRYDRFHDPHEAQQKKIKEYCQGCPVNLQCYQDAMKFTDPFLWNPYGEADGIWGGTTRRERRKTKRRTAKQIELLLVQLGGQSLGKNIPNASQGDGPDGIQSQAS